MNISESLRPNNPDGVLRVIIPGRISDPKQDRKSIDSQHFDRERWLDQVYRGPLKIHRFGDQASGWLADRPCMVEAEEMIRSGQWDVVVAGELREIARNPRFIWAFVQNCVDSGVRFISVAEGVDTADEEWESRLHVAILLAGMAVPEIRRRIRRKATHEFSLGGMVMKVRFGYRKLTKEEAASGNYGPKGLRIAKVPSATPILHRMRIAVLQGQSYEMVADWLNDEGVPPGPYATKGKWTGTLVRNLLQDPILSGRRRFRVAISRLVFESGKHRSRPNPKGPEIQEWQELAHYTSEEHSELLKEMKRRKEEAKTGHPPRRESPLFNVPRTRTYWPGQAITCAVCGGLFYRFGAVLKCMNARGQGPRECWNRVQVRIDVVHAKILPLILQYLDRVPGTRQVIARVAWEEYQRLRGRQNRSATDLDAQISDLELKGKNLAKAIAKGLLLESLEAEATEVQKQLNALRQERIKLVSPVEPGEGYRSADDVLAGLDSAVKWLIEQSRDFADIMRRLIPTFVITPVQALDTSQVRPRANLVISARLWAKEGEEVPESNASIDLFEPPVHIKHLVECVAAERADPSASLTKIAAHVGVGHMTVKRALDYHGLMEIEGITEPYRVLSLPPTDASRWGKQEWSRPTVTSDVID